MFDSQQLSLLKRPSGLDFITRRARNVATFSGPHRSDCKYFLTQRQECSGLAIAGGRKSQAHTHTPDGEIIRNVFFPISLKSLTRVCLLVQLHDTRKGSFSPLVCFYLDNVENPRVGWWWHWWDWWDWWGRRQSPIVQTLPAFLMCCCLILPTTYTLESRCLMRETDEQRLEQLTLGMEGSLMMPRVVCANKGLLLILGENRMISKWTQVCKSCKGK